jgi:hypothetical protein
MPKKSLDDILSGDDPLGLLNVKPSLVGGTPDTRTESDFEEINSFVDHHGYEPGKNPKPGKMSLNESKLQIRLKTLRSNSEQAQQLQKFDRYSLLIVETPPAAKSLDDILASGSPLLTGPADHIFNLRPELVRPAEPDKVSERRPCKDFAEFEPIFAQAAKDLESGARSTVKFAQEQTIKAGEMFILGGLMAYVAELNDPQIRNGKPDARLRVIFENGLEGENLLRSLASQLYSDENGRRFTTNDAGPLFESEPLGPMVSTGYIYIAKSLSAEPQVVELADSLFKIGFTTGDPADRIRTAKDDPTFLLAPAHLIRTYQTSNINPNRFENLIHRFFGPARLDIEINDRFGKKVKPREWFLVPLDIVERSIKMFLDGSIVDYHYDLKTSSIVPNKPH